MASSILLSLLLLCGLACSSAAANPDADFIKCLQYNAKSDPKISQIVYTPKTPNFTTVLNAYIRNPRFLTPQTRKPSLIITPLNPPQIQAAVICTKKSNFLVKIRSGGHDYEGISYTSDRDFVILDLFNLRSIDVNIKDQTAWVQAGATIGELYYRIWENSRVHGFPAGVGPTMGVGGHISGGGYGTLLRKYGLSVDHVIDAQIVDVKGRLLDRKSMGEDLFWAIRGGGGASFGVVVAYKVKLVPVPPVVTVFKVPKTLEENATDIFYQWQSVADKVDENLFIRVLLQPSTQNKKKTVRVTFNGLFLGNAEQLLSVIKSQFPNLGLKKQDVLETTWIQSTLFWANLNGSETILLNRSSDSENSIKRKSDYLKTPMSLQGIQGLFKTISELGKAGLAINAYGGQMAKIPESATPFPHRAGNIFKIQYFANWKEPGKEAESKYINQTRVLYDYMTPFVSKNPREAFLNYRDLDIGTIRDFGNAYEEAKVFGLKYFKENFHRLVKVKTIVDPENFFRNEQSIPPMPGKPRLEENEDP